MKMEVALPSREAAAGSPVLVRSGYTSVGVCISGFLLCERIYHPGWVPLTSSQMQFLTHMAGLQSRPAMIPGFPALTGGQQEGPHCCLFLLLLPPESLRIQGLERQRPILTTQCFHPYHIYNLPAGLYPYGSHVT